MALDRAARIAMAWSMILVLFQLAERHLNRDHRWRATLAEAVFPLYIAHHPAIVVLAWFTLPLGAEPVRRVRAVARRHLRVRDRFLSDRTRNRLAAPADRTGAAISPPDGNAGCRAR